MPGAQPTRALTPLGERIDAARGETTLRAVARKAGYSGAYLSQMRREPHANPGIITITNLAEALGVSPGWLAFGDGE